MTLSAAGERDSPHRPRRATTCEPDPGLSPDKAAAGTVGDLTDVAKQPLVAGSISEAALKAFYDVTAPPLAHALSALHDREFVERVLVATYERVWVEAALRPLPQADAVAWLTRTALLEVSAARHRLRAEPTPTSLG